MILSPEFLQFLGSLIAIFALAGLAHWMGLGREARILSENEACEAAREVVEGFDPQIVAIDSEGMGAILMDRKDQIMILKLHGNKVAGRLLGSRGSASVQNEVLSIDSGERRYGKVCLRIDGAHTWAGRINALGKTCDA